MSLISSSRSVPAARIVRANSSCFELRLPASLSDSSFNRISRLFSGARSSWLMFARNSDVYRELSANWAAFSSSPRRACLSQMAAAIAALLETDRASGRAPAGPPATLLAQTLLGMNVRAMELDIRTILETGRPTPNLAATLTTTWVRALYANDRP
jgi:hypothetical protein